MKKIIIIQLGAREHYAWAEMANDNGELLCLITDFWFYNLPKILQLIINYCGIKLKSRCKVTLQNANVISFTWSYLLFELSSRLFSRSGWTYYEQRNLWFQKKVAKFLSSAQFDKSSIIVSYSYTAKLVFEATPQHYHVLLQIDGGKQEEHLIKEQAKGYSIEHNSPSEQYWLDWSKELELANRIVVNSTWSKQLISAYINESKIQTIALCSQGIERAKQKLSLPLKVLYLGTATPRKGIHLLLEVAKRMQNQAISFSIVGSNQEQYLRAYGNLSNCQFFGHIPNNKTEILYDSHPVFILPTFSDGFALTQLEAAYHGCYLMVSKNCADVLQYYQYGEYLDVLTADAIERQLLKLILEIDSINASKNINTAWSQNYQPARLYLNSHTWKH